MSWKIPVSVLVVIHTKSLDVLLLERARRPDFWQSVTGSLDHLAEPLDCTARREVIEETGIDCATGKLQRWGVSNTFEIYTRWRHRYAPGTTHNTEHVFGLELNERPPVRISPQEHQAWVWLPWREAAEKCFSWSNRDAIRLIAGEWQIPALATDA